MYLYAARVSAVCWALYECGISRDSQKSASERGRSLYKMNEPFMII